MTQKELSQIRYLKREIEQDAERLREFEKHDISGLPYEKQVTPETAAQIAECRAIIEAKRQAAAEEYERLCRYISDIEDDLMRRIIVLRYVGGYDWTQVAMFVGGGNTAESLRKAHERFLKALKLPQNATKKKKEPRFEIT